MVRYTGFLISCFILLLFFSFTHKATERISTKAQLGAKLFREKILSLDSSVSCASCHRPEHAFADKVAFSRGIHQTPAKRNTPSVLNMLNRSIYFYDGRAASLEEQALMPIENRDEMGLPVQIAVERLNNTPGYKTLFQKIFKEDPSSANLAQALAAFEKTLETVNSKFDDWSYSKRKKWTDSEERGRVLFTGEKAKCFNCHNREDFTNDDFKNIGLFNGKELNDSGRFVITRKPADMGKFKTPGLRNIGATAPYMHNGIFKTLEAVVDYYNEPQKFITGAVNTDKDLQQPLGLTAREKTDLVAFLKTLTDRRYLPKNK